MSIIRIRWDLWHSKKNNTAYGQFLLPCVQKTTAGIRTVVFSFSCEKGLQIRKFFIFFETNCKALAYIQTETQ